MANFYPRLGVSFAALNFFLIIALPRILWAEANLEFFVDHVQTRAEIVVPGSLQCSYKHVAVLESTGVLQFVEPQREYLCSCQKTAVGCRWDVSSEWEADYGDGLAACPVGYRPVGLLPFDSIDWTPLRCPNKGEFRFAEVQQVWNSMLYAVPENEIEDLERQNRTCEWDCRLEGYGSLREDMSRLLCGALDPEVIRMSGAIVCTEASSLKTSS